MTKQQQRRLTALADQLDEMSRRSLGLWLDAGLDPLGGAHGFLDRRYRPQLDPEHEPRGPSGEVRGDQLLVQQARHLYAYTLYSERRPAEPRAVEFAHALYAHLVGEFEQEEGFIHVRARDGRVRSRARQLYAQSFAVFALATYGRVFTDDVARQTALVHFERLDRDLHDDVHGGYDQTCDGGWLEFVAAPPAAVKCTNTHIHVLEMLTALSRAFPEALLVRERTTELTRLIATRLLQPSGYLPPFFDMAWQPVGPPRVSYGHDVETAWLLLDALDALALSHAGETPDLIEPLVRQSAIRMVDHASRTGWDEAGGFFDFGVPEGASGPPVVLGKDKVWWAQAEALPGLYRVFRLTGDEALVLRLERTADFLAQRSWDQECGGYYWGVDSFGRSLGRGDHKGEFWKTPYHDVRACVLTADWIRQDTASPAGQDSG